MQLVMRRYRLPAQSFWSKFHITARMVVNPEEAELLNKYRLHNVIITEGDMWRDIRRALMISTPVSIFLGIEIAKAITPAPTIIFIIYIISISLILLSFFLYHQIREEVRVKDLETGRDFKARSFIGLLNKEQMIRKMALVFAKVVEQARTWEEPEVVDLEPQPLLTVLEGSDREAA